MEHWINGKQKAAVLEESEFRRESFRIMFIPGAAVYNLAILARHLKLFIFLEPACKRLNMPLQYLKKVHIPLYRP